MYFEKKVLQNFSTFFVSNFKIEIESICLDNSQQLFYHTLCLFFLWLFYLLDSITIHFESTVMAPLTDIFYTELNQITSFKVKLLLLPMLDCLSAAVQLTNAKLCSIQANLLPYWGFYTIWTVTVSK